MSIVSPARPGASAGVIRVGVVAIGRNEGSRLARCFDALPPDVSHVVYVDSASTDGSIDLAGRRGIEVLSLDMSLPFTAARARNAGLERLLQLEPRLELVQFVDGDCELLPGWQERALLVMATDPGVAAVCGRLRERHREATIYNRLCDLEWDELTGEVNACGGNAVYRVVAFRQAGGFDASLIAGEEPELCFRLRSRGHRILRLPVDMALHDAAMTHFGQWWRRSLRGGHAYAEVEAKHPGMWRRETRSILLWGLILPAGIAISLPATAGQGLALAIAYPALWLRIFVNRVRRSSIRDAALFATFCVLGKLPEAVGMAKYWWNRRSGRRSRLIEYK